MADSSRDLGVSSCRFTLALYLRLNTFCRLKMWVIGSLRDEIKSGLFIAHAQRSAREASLNSVDFGPAAASKKPAQISVAMYGVQMIVNPKPLNPKSLGQTQSEPKSRNATVAVEVTLELWLCRTPYSRRFWHSNRGGRSICGHPRATLNCTRHVSGNGVIHCNSCRTILGTQKGILIQETTHVGFRVLGPGPTLRTLNPGPLDTLRLCTLYPENKRNTETKAPSKPCRTVQGLGYQPLAVTSGSGCLPNGLGFRVLGFRVLRFRVCAKGFIQGPENLE